jgi:hypothetical protein
MINSKLLWISAMASIALVALIAAENVQASILEERLADVDEEEAAIAENASTTSGTNETGTGNMTATNSTN